MLKPSSLDAIRRRDRLIILGGLAVLTSLSWFYMAGMGWSMGNVSMEMSADHRRALGFPEMAFVFGMWSVMMVGMMLPTASPMVLTFSSICRRRTPERTFARVAMFVLGYVVVWTGYGALASVAQWVLYTAALLSPMGDSTSPYLAGSLLVISGIFQLTPLKHACLDRCRTPMGFLLAEWRPGPRGALIMGLRHGLNCAGCCWAIMTLMFVLGVMNLLWMAVLAIFCLMEKIAPAGHHVRRVGGVLLTGWGMLVLAKVL